MERRYITTSIFIEPEDFDTRRLYDAVLLSVQKKEKTCNSADGYIDHIVYAIHRIVNKNLLDNGSCHLDVTFEAYCFRPEIGKRVRTTVEFVFAQGVLATLGELKFLIPLSDISDRFSFDIVKDVFHHIKTTQTIEKDTALFLEITDMKYEKEQYSCIAHLVDIFPSSPS
jgi:DNA-directed RNA polymerase subunit E'/Rpb7